MIAGPFTIAGPPPAGPLGCLRRRMAEAVNRRLGMLADGVARQAGAPEAPPSSAEAVPQPLVMIIRPLGPVELCRLPEAEAERGTFMAGLIGGPFNVISRRMPGGGSVLWEAYVAEAEPEAGAPPVNTRGYALATALGWNGRPSVMRGTVVFAGLAEAGAADCPAELIALAGQICGPQAEPEAGRG